MTDTLTKFGSSFQSKIIMSLLSNKEFIQTISDIIEPSIFDSDANKWLVKSIKDYFIEYKTPPTLEVLKIKVGELENDILKTSVIEKLKDAWNHREATDLNFVKKD